MKITKSGHNEAARRDEHDGISRSIGKEGTGKIRGCMLEMRDVACGVNG
jgi:hypothetical protein